VTAPRAAKDSLAGRRYTIVYPDGTEAKLPGANTALSALDKPGLTIWKQKRIAYGIAHDPHRLEMAKDWSTVWTAVRSCLDESSHEADLGTSVHAVTAAIDLGEPIDWRTMLVPGIEREEAEPYVNQWVQCKHDHRIEIVAVETTVWNRTHDYAGTFDLVGKFPAIESELPLIADKKTGSAVWPDTALQLAAYANGEGTYSVETGTGPMPPVSHDLGVVIHLQPNRYAVVPMQLRDAWRAFLAARQAFKWASEHSKHAVLPILAPPPTEKDLW
jgi:hypothetical protein